MLTTSAHFIEHCVAVAQRSRFQNRQSLVADGEIERFRRVVLFPIHRRGWLERFTFKVQFHAARCWANLIRACRDLVSPSQNISLRQFADNTIRILLRRLSNTIQPRLDRPHRADRDAPCMEALESKPTMEAEQIRLCRSVYWGICINCYLTCSAYHYDSYAPQRKEWICLCIRHEYGHNGG